jgi:hypothetical protein
VHVTDLILGHIETLPGAIGIIRLPWERYAMLRQCQHKGWGVDYHEDETSIDMIKNDGRDDYR